MGSKLPRVNSRGFWICNECLERLDIMHPLVVVESRVQANGERLVMTLKVYKCPQCGHEEDFRKEK